MIDTKKPTEYDAAVAMLVDLWPTGHTDGDAAAFGQRVQQLRNANTMRPSLLDRLDRAGLGAIRQK